MDENSLRLLITQGVSVEQIARRFGRDPSTVSYWMRKYGLDAPNREKYAAKGGIERETLEALIEQGASIGAIATELHRSSATVRHWLTRYGLQTHATTRRRSARVAREAGEDVLEGSCEHHGTTRFWLDGRGRYRCLACRQEYVTRRRRKVKLILITEAGGRCALCGYDRYVGALQFHHRRREEKSFGLSDAGLARSLEAARAEARKCVLLCSNCHAEVEGGIASAPA